MQEITLGQGKAAVKVKTLDGAEYVVRKPKAAEVLEYERMSADEKADKIGALFSYLEALGLPKAVSAEMTIDEIQALAEALAPKKK